MKMLVVNEAGSLYFLALAGPTCRSRASRSWASGAGLPGAHISDLCKCNYTHNRPENHTINHPWRLMPSANAHHTSRSQSWLWAAGSGELRF